MQRNTGKQQNGKGLRSLQERDTKETFPAEMGTIQDRNSMDLTKAGDIKKRWQELYTTDLNDPDNHEVLITHLEPDILDHEVKWGLGSIPMNKTSGSDRIPAELFLNPKR